MKQQTNKRKDEPRAPLCPFAGFKPCHGEQCSMWDDDWRICSLNNGSLYSNIRAAVCDAAVEIIKHYGGRLMTGSEATSSGASRHLPQGGRHGR